MVVFMESGDIQVMQTLTIGEISNQSSLCAKKVKISHLSILQRMMNDVVLANGLEEIKFHYTSNATTAVNNGHAVKVDVANGSFIEVDGIRFDLKQFHFHSPSENTIEGKYFPLEAHFVHQSKDGRTARCCSCDV